MPAKMNKPGGVYSDIKPHEYHADPCPEPSLSRSVAMTLITRTPRHAWLEHPKFNPLYEHQTDEKFDLGSAAHSILLNKGADIHVVDADSWRTNDAKRQRDEARAAGCIPLLADQYAQAEDAAAAVLDQIEHIPTLANVQNKGESELVVASYDPVAGWMRCMLDKAHEQQIIVDYKFTSIALSPEALGRHCAMMRYEFQQEFYKRVLANLGVKDPQFIFCFVENKPPFAVLPVILPPDAEAKGAAQVNEACHSWQREKLERRWPLFGNSIQRIEYPPYATAAWADMQEEAAE